MGKAVICKKPQSPSEQVDTSGGIGWQTLGLGSRCLDRDVFMYAHALYMHVVKAMGRSFFRFPIK